jgi:Ion channel
MGSATWPVCHQLALSKTGSRADRPVVSPSFSPTQADRAEKLVEYNAIIDAAVARLATPDGMLEAADRLHNTIQAGRQASPTSTWTGWRFFYLSMITLSSLGLSDITPVHPFARSLVMLEALLGQMYTTILLARLVSLEVADRIRRHKIRIVLSPSAKCESGLRAPIDPGGGK